MLEGLNMRKCLVIIVVIILMLQLNACSAENEDERQKGETNTEMSLQEMEIVFFNAGKADCFLIQTENSVVLIDTGKNKMGEQIVSYCKEHEIEHIDALFITHFDKDHVGGADAVLEAVSVEKVYEPAYFSESKQYLQYIEALQVSAANVETLQNNTSFVLDGVSYKVDIANKSDYGPDEENDFSLVLSVQYGEISFLFAGDAENQRLMELLDENVQKHTVLKVPHHGRYESTSELFFKAVSPKYAVITSDEKNPEDKEVVSLLESFGTDVYFTKEGTIYCTTDGKNVSFVQEEKYS